MSIYDKLGISKKTVEFLVVLQENAILKERCAQLEERLGEARHATTQQVNLAFQGMEMAEKLTRPAESPAQTIATALQAALQILEVWNHNQKPSTSAAPRADFWVSVSEFTAIFARAQGRADLAQELRSRVEEFKFGYNSVQEVLEACQTLWPLVVGEEREPEDVEGDEEEDFVLSRFARGYAESRGRADLAEDLERELEKILPIWPYGLDAESRKKREELTSDAWAWVINKQGGSRD